MKIVAVTSCPTGIAHTYMAAEALEQAAKDAGHDIKVETQGAAGAEAVAEQRGGQALVEALEGDCLHQRHQVSQALGEDSEHETTERVVAAPSVEPGRAQHHQACRAGRDAVRKHRALAEQA